MLSVEGIYNGKTVKPLIPINFNRPSKVIITFLDETIENEFKIQDQIEIYRLKASKFDFGEEPDEEYKKELISIYNETLTRY